MVRFFSIGKSSKMFLFFCVNSHNDLHQTCDILVQTVNYDLCKLDRSVMSELMEFDCIFILRNYTWKFITYEMIGFWFTETPIHMYVI